MTGIPFEVITHPAQPVPGGHSEYEELDFSPTVVDAAARAIEASTVFRKRFQPDWSKDIHPDARKLAGIALMAAARHAREVT